MEQARQALDNPETLKRFEQEQEAEFRAQRERPARQEKRQRQELYRGIQKQHAG